MKNSDRVDDPSIEDGDDLWRRIHPDHIVPDRNTGQWRPSSAAFTDSGQTNTPMSVYIAKLVAESGRTHNEVMERYPEHSLVVFLAGVARSLGLGVTKEPDPQYPEETAHGVVFGDKTQSVRKKLAKASEWLLLRTGAPNAKLPK